MGQGLPRLRQLAALFAAALVLCGVALWNGQPVFYPDTASYVRGAEQGLGYVLGPVIAQDWSSPGQSKGLEPASSDAERVVLAGRSVYYGGLLYAGYAAGGMWLTIALQALAVAYVLHLLMVRLWGLRGRHVVGAAAALSLLTPLGAYTGLLMPDVFASLVILAIAVLSLYWEQLPRRHRWALAGLLLFGLCTHSSHLVFAGLLLMVALGARCFSRRWRGISLPGLAVMAGCMLGALGAEWVYVKSVDTALGSPPLRFPHLTGHLIDMGPGTDYLKQRCPDAGYATCAFVQNYPTDWVDFLFAKDPAKGTFAIADEATKRRLSGEQIGFFLDVLRHDPSGVIRGLSADVLRQIGMFRVDILRYGDAGLATQAEQVPAPLMATMVESRAASPSRMEDWLTITTYATVLASAALLLGAAWRRGFSSMPDRLAGAAQRRFADFAWIVIGGVLANAIICATLASSLDRFQARVVWLLPFLALTMLLVHLVQKPSLQADAGKLADGSGCALDPDPQQRQPAMASAKRAGRRRWAITGVLTSSSSTRRRTAAVESSRNLRAK